LGIPAEAVSTEYPIDGVLDLHTFQPREVRELVTAYIQACRERGILHVRLIHGKGTGTLRRVVLSTLERLSEVSAVQAAPGDAGGWGATLVTLRPHEECPPLHDPSE